MATRNPFNACGGCGASTRSDGRPLDRCAKCKIQLYCSRDCQKSHWKSHKIFCKIILGNFDAATKVDNPGTVTTEFSEPDAGRSGVGMIFITRALDIDTRSGSFALDCNAVHGIPRDHWDSPHWDKVPVLGFPLRLMLVFEDTGSPNSACRLCGQGIEEASALKGKTAEQRGAQKAALAERMLTPQAFKTFFDEWKQEGMMKHPERWEGVESPTEAECLREIVENRETGVMEVFSGESSTPQGTGSAVS
ncbi:hypothetical protein LTR37_014395 [Vermiconidia calcicola]|uniref:Uncharacterized protein n=1 Tax=Vermiconidia calcicola TaxID=1690605 RepID=A0ACC3MUE4_9PEZI|nr:hypothetical protein LTR37_014395 [Vermiconidia calcicola]